MYVWKLQYHSLYNKYNETMDVKLVLTKYTFLPH